MGTCELLVVAWDGAPPELLREWAGAGLLPTLGELLERAAWGTVESTLPPITAPAWASFQTGCGPGKHGVFGWAGRAPKRYTPTLVDSRALAVPTVWELISPHRRVGIVGFPLSCPPREVRGFWVPGFLAPEGADGHPPGIMAEARLIAPDFSPSPSEWTPSIPPEQWAQELIRGIEAEARVAIGLAGRYRPAAVAIHFQATDTVQHYLWGRPEVLSVFQAADRALAELLSALRPRWLILLSDHGMGPLEGEFHVNTWLLKEGFLRLRRRPGPAMRRTLFRCGLTPRGLQHVGHRLYSLARRLGIVRSSADLWARGPFARAARTFFLTLRDVDWERTWAYSHAEVGSIFLNRAGREPRGIVRPPDAPSILRDLAQGLEELRLPDGRPFLGKLWFGTEIYRGEQAHLGPDLVFLSAGLRWMGKGLGGFLYHEVFSPPARAAGHRMEGTLLFSGEGVEAGRGLHGKLWDIAPTILSLLEVPIPKQLDGRPLVEGFQSGFLRPEYVSEPVRARQGYGEDTVDRLRGYGYL